MYNRRRQAGDGTLQSKDEAASAATPCVHLSMAYSAKMPGSSATRASLKSAVQLSQSAPVLRRHNPRPRASAVGIAPTRMALLVLSTLATIASGSAPGSFDTTVSLQTAVQMWNSSQATALNTYGPISGWDVSLVTDMRGLFSEFATFDEDVTNWDTSSVTDMSRMFSVRSARA